jgi:hypothetical protein
LRNKSNQASVEWETSSAFGVLHACIVFGYTLKTERSYLLRYAIRYLRGSKMHLRNEKKPKKLDLLELTEVERRKVIKAIRKSLGQKVAEAKLRQSFAKASNLTVNGKIAPCDTSLLKGISIIDRLRSL